MSQFIYVCPRSGQAKNQGSKKKIESICGSISKELSDITKFECLEIGEGTAGIINPFSHFLKNSLAACFGVLFEDSNSWDIPLSDKPDGNYAIVRTDNNNVEVVSDKAGSRTVWYYFDDDTFI